MAQSSNSYAPDNGRALFSDRAGLEQDIARLLADFTRNHPAIAGLNLSLYRRIGKFTAAEEYGVQVMPCE